jgi:hypothetical protein
MRTFDDVFAEFGGPTKLARAIGIEPFHAQTMKTRGSIPPAYWSKIIEAAREQRIRGLSYEKLTAMAEDRAARERVAS